MARWCASPPYRPWGSHQHAGMHVAAAYSPTQNLWWQTSFPRCLNRWIRISWFSVHQFPKYVNIISTWSWCSKLRTTATTNGSLVELNNSILNSCRHLYRILNRTINYMYMVPSYLGSLCATSGNLLRAYSSRNRFFCFTLALSRSHDTICSLTPSYRSDWR